MVGMIMYKEKAVYVRRAKWVRRGRSARDVVAVCLTCRRVVLPATGLVVERGREERGVYVFKHEHPLGFLTLFKGEGVSGVGYTEELAKEPLLVETAAKVWRKTGRVGDVVCTLIFLLGEGSEGKREG